MKWPVLQEAVEQATDGQPIQMELRQPAVSLVVSERI